MVLLGDRECLHHNSCWINYLSDESAGRTTSSREERSEKRERPRRTDYDGAMTPQAKENSLFVVAHDEVGSHLAGTKARAWHRYVPL